MNFKCLQKVQADGQAEEREDLSLSPGSWTRVPAAQSSLHSLLMFLIFLLYQPLSFFLGFTPVPGQIEVFCPFCCLSVCPTPCPVKRISLTLGGEENSASEQVKCALLLGWEMFTYLLERMELVARNCQSPSWVTGASGKDTKAAAGKQNHFTHVQAALIQSVVCWDCQNIIQQKSVWNLGLYN